MAARKTRAGVPTTPGTPAYYRPFIPLGPRPPVTPEGIEIARNAVRLAKSLGRKRPDRSWAPRLLERAASGEKICNYGIELAQSVVRMTPEREPGSNDEG